LDLAVDSALADVGDIGEVIVVLDGPMKPIIADWACDARVRLVATGTPIGTPNALNAGLCAARGEFILRLDADDEALNGRASRLMRELQSDRSLVAIGSWARMVSSDGQPLGMMRTPVSDVEVAERLLCRNAVIHSTIMMRRTTLEQLGGYNQKCLRMQDYELFLRLAQLGRIRNVPEALILYRVHDGQSSRQTSPYAAYTWQVVRAQYKYGRFAGQGAATTLFRCSRWWLSKALRHHGLRRARYLTDATSP
jgi:glycosyltransferase involved in cell wall biosynthesis